MPTSVSQHTMARVDRPTRESRCSGVADLARPPSSSDARLNAAAEKEKNGGKEHCSETVTLTNEVPFKSLQGNSTHIRWDLIIGLKAEACSLFHVGQVLPDLAGQRSGGLPWSNYKV